MPGEAANSSSSGSSSGGGGVGKYSASPPTESWGGDL